MKELQRFRQFLNENLDEISLRGLMGRDMTGAEIATDPKKFEALLGKIMSHIGDPSLEDKVRAWLKVELEEYADTDFSDPEEVKMTAKSAAYAMGLDDDDDLPSLNEGDFGTKKKAALENSLTGMAKAMVEDGDLFAEGGNVTYDEEDLKDGATPEQIEAIDQIKMAVANMGGRVVYGNSDQDGTLMYTYLVDGAGLKVMTKENDENNLFHSVFNP